MSVRRDFVCVMLLILPMIYGERCESEDAINICGNAVKTGSLLYLDINIQPKDNIDNCSCLLQFIQSDPDAAHVRFTSSSVSNWCYYSLTIKNPLTTGRFLCGGTTPKLTFNLRHTETLDILLKKERHPTSNITRCVQINSDSSVRVSCSLPDNQRNTTTSTKTTTLTSIFDTTTFTKTITPISIFNTTASTKTTTSISIFNTTASTKTTTSISIFDTTASTKTTISTSIFDTTASTKTTTPTSRFDTISSTKTTTPTSRFDTISSTKTTTSTSIFNNIITDSTVSLSSTSDSELENKQKNTKTPVRAIIGGVLGVILVIGGVVLTILIWRCYRNRTPEEDNTYTSLDLQNNITLTDVTYQALQNIPPPLTTTTLTHPPSRSHTNGHLESPQQISAVDSDPNSTSTSSYENLVSCQPAVTGQNYENLSSKNHPNQQTSTVHEYENLPGT